MSLGQLVIHPMLQKEAMVEQHHLELLCMHMAEKEEALRNVHPVDTVVTVATGDEVAQDTILPQQEMAEMARSLAVDMETLEETAGNMVVAAAE